MADTPRPQETYQEQMARQRREAGAPRRKRIELYVTVGMLLVFFGLIMAGL